MVSWKLAIFLLFVAVTSVTAQDDPAESAPPPPPPDTPAPEERKCEGCKDGRNCWYNGDIFLKDGQDWICKDGKMEVKKDEFAGKCQSHSELGPKWVKPDEEYVLRCNTWKCGGDFGVMLFQRSACRDDTDKCFEDGQILIKNGQKVLCRIFGSSHAYEFAPEEPKSTDAPPSDDDSRK